MSVPANFFDTYDVVASPADDTETVVAVLSGVGELLPNLGVHLHGWVALEVDADATHLDLQVRRDNIAGQIVGGPGVVEIGTPGAIPQTPVTVDVVDFPGDFAGAVYVLTLTAEDASGATTVDQVHLGARTC